MRTFKAYWGKEMKESWHRRRYLILSIGFVFWAIINPLTLKILPYALQGSVPGPLLAELTRIGQVEAVQNYMKDVITIGSLFLAFSLMGVMADEMEGQYLVFPYIKGASPVGIVLAKFIHYGLTLSILVLAGFLVNYYYVSIFFQGEELALVTLFPSIMLFVLYYLFNVALLTWLSSLCRQGLVAKIVFLVTVFASASLQQIHGLRQYLPYYLIEWARQIGQTAFTNLWPAILIVLTGVLVFNLLAVIRLRKIDINR